MTEPETSPDLFLRWYLSRSQSRRLVNELRRWVTELTPVTLPDSAGIPPVSEAPPLAPPESPNLGTPAVDSDFASVVAETEALVRWGCPKIEGAATIVSNSGPGGGVARRPMPGWIRLESRGEADSDDSGCPGLDGVSLVLSEAVVDAARGVGQLADLCRNVVCGGAVPIGVLAVDWDDGGADTGAGDPLEPYLGACTVLAIDLFRTHSTRERSGGQGKEPRWLMVGVACEQDITPSAVLEGEGESILLLGEPVDRADPLQGLDPGVWWNQIRREARGAFRPVDLLKESERHDALRMLLAGGRIRGVISCEQGGMAWSVMSAVLGASHSMGVSLDLTELLSGEPKEGVPPMRWEALWFGETRGRVLVTTLALDAGKVLAQARILGVPAALVGRTGGDGVRLRLPAGEAVWQMERLRAIAAGDLEVGASPAGAAAK